jgi:hypothetical protein
LSRGVLTVPWCPDRYTGGDTEHSDDRSVVSPVKPSIPAANPDGVVFDATPTAKAISLLQ